jgi:hypothetical protein
MEKQRPILAMRLRHDFAFPRREASGFCQKIRSLRYQRAQGMPGARRTRSLACKIKKHTSVVTTVTSGSPDIPRAMVYGLFRALPGDQVFLTPSSAECSTDLTPTSRRQDHTLSPSASTPFVNGASTSTASRSASVTIASRPFGRNGTAVDVQLIWVFWKSEYFSIWGLTGFW